MNVLGYLMLQASTGSGGLPVNLILMVAMFAVFYFFLIRPQSKKAKEQKEFLAAIKKGDKVVTAGGIHGKVVQADENDSSVLLQVDENTKLRIEKSMISTELTKSILSNQ
jgi:preprotein translocase subunit YajC